jgi:hypothetical protein
VIKSSKWIYARHVGGSKDLIGERKRKMKYRYEEKPLENKIQRELYQNPPKPLPYETEPGVKREYILRYLYAGIELFDRLIREAKQELEDKKLYYRS